MKKIFLLSLMIFTAFVGLAKSKSPFSQVRSHPQVQTLQKHFRNTIVPGNARISSLSYPDSVLINSWNGASWELDAALRMNYNGGRISSATLYQVAGPISLPIGGYAFVYNTAGKVLSIQLTVALPGQNPVVINRFEQNFDAFGNQTSLKIFEADQNGNLELTEGDSVAFTYSGSQVTQATNYFWDQSSTPASWTPETRFSNLTFNASGEPTAVTVAYWDPATNGFDPSDEKYTNLQWRFGFPGISLAFGQIGDISAVLFNETAIPSDDLRLTPTDYTLEEKLNGVYVNSEKASSTPASGPVAITLYQSWSGSAWEDDYRYQYTYSGNFVNVSLEEFWTGTVWEPNYRYTSTYNAQNHLTEEKNESYINSSWSLVVAYRNTYNYSTDNRIFRWVTEEWDQWNNAYVNYEKRDYFYGSFPQSVAVGKLNGFSTYPNPVNDLLFVEFEAKPNNTYQLSLFSVDGQLMHHQTISGVTGKQKIDVSTDQLASGVYFVRVEGQNGVSIAKIVK
jgi:hypothetical protein